MDRSSSGSSEQSGRWASPSLPLLSPPVPTALLPLERPWPLLPPLHPDQLREGPWRPCLRGWLCLFTGPYRSRNGRNVRCHSSQGTFALPEPRKTIPRWEESAPALGGPLPNPQVTVCSLGGPPAPAQSRRKRVWAGGQGTQMQRVSVPAWLGQVRGPGAWPVWAGRAQDQGWLLPWMWGPPEALCGGVRGAWGRPCRLVALSGGRALGIFSRCRGSRPRRGSSWSCLRSGTRGAYSSCSGTRGSVRRGGFFWLPHPGISDPGSEIHRCHSTRVRLVKPKCWKGDVPVGVIGQWPFSRGPSRMGGLPGQGWGTSGRGLRNHVVLPCQGRRGC